MSEFNLKYRDTLPILDVYLLNPDGTPADITGATSARIHIRQINGTTATKAATIQAVSPAQLRYAWVAADWTDPTAPLIVGTHRMEYEVLGPGSARLTWPNDGYDALRITDDLGQG